MTDMQISASLRAQAGLVINVLLNEAANFIADQPLGSYTPIGALNRAMSGVGAMLNLKVVQERLQERGSAHNFYVVKGTGGIPAGLLIISAEAHQAAQRVHTRPPYREPRANGS